MTALPAHNAGAVRALLETLGIPAQTLAHAPVHTMEETRAVFLALGASMCKNLLGQHRTSRARVSLRVFSLITASKMRAIALLLLCFCPCFKRKSIALPSTLPLCGIAFLQNRQGTSFFLLLLPGDKPFVSGAASRAMGQPRLNFGVPESLERLLGVHPGAVSPLGLARDTGREVTLFLDTRLQTLQTPVVHACVNTCSVALPMAAFLRVFLPYTGHKANWVNLP